jgi:hypothetical protein
MKNALDLPKKYSLTPQSMAVFSTESKFSKILVFVKENWVWILAGITVFALVHTYWYFQKMGVEEFLKAC